MLIVNTNYRELFINSVRSKLHDKLHGNYMLKVSSVAQAAPVATVAAVPAQASATTVPVPAPPAPASTAASTGTTGSKFPHTHTGQCGFDSRTGHNEENNFR